ncbi:MAG: hypothetical protein AAF471_06190 [Myxococcota bacterium]
MNRSITKWPLVAGVLGIAVGIAIYRFNETRSPQAPQHAVEEDIWHDDMGDDSDLAEEPLPDTAGGNNKRGSSTNLPAAPKPPEKNSVKQDGQPQTGPRTDDDSSNTNVSATALREVLPEIRETMDDLLATARDAKETLSDKERERLARLEQLINHEKQLNAGVSEEEQKQLMEQVEQARNGLSELGEEIEQGLEKGIPLNPVHRLFVAYFLFGSMSEIAHGRKDDLIQKSELAELTKFLDAFARKAPRLRPLQRIIQNLRDNTD